MKTFTVSQFLSRYPRQERTLLIATAVYLIAHFASNVWGDFGDSVGFDLLFDIALSLLFPAGILYALVRREWGLYSVMFALVALGTVASLALLAWFTNTVGISVAFGDLNIRIENWLRATDIVLAVPVLILMFNLLRPRYKMRREVRAMSDDGLVTHFASAARESYAQWRRQDPEKRHRTLGWLAAIKSEFKRRDPTLRNLAVLLHEPDDWVKITAARYMLEVDPTVALNTLDTVGKQHGEWSSYARDVASKWRDRTLVRWN